MPRPRRISDAQIRDAARATFVAHGPSAPVARVAERLGVSHAALFHRVGSKERLLREALCPGVPRAVETLAREPDGDRPVRAQLIAVLDELLAFHRAIVPGLFVLRVSGADMASSLGGQEPPPVVLRRRLARWLARAGAAEGIPLAAPAMTAEALLGAIEARCFNAHFGGPTFAPGTDRRFVRCLVDALVPAAQPRHAKEEPHEDRRPRRDRPHRKDHREQGARGGPRGPRARS